MIFDVIVRQGYNDKGKQVINVSRIHDAGLNTYLRIVQDKGGYIISVIPLFRVKRQEKKEEINRQTQEMVDFAEEDVTRL